MNIRTLDSWMFRGFSALLSQIKTRLMQTPAPYNKIAVDKLRQQRQRLAELIMMNQIQPCTTQQQIHFDCWSANCLELLITMVEARVNQTFGTSDQLPSLRSELNSLDSLIKALEEKEERHKNPYAQGAKDFNEGWPPRGDKIFDQDHLIKSYLEGYSDERKKRQK